MCWEEIEVIPKLHWTFLHILSNLRVGTRLRGGCGGDTGGGSVLFYLDSCFDGRPSGCSEKGSVFVTLVLVVLGLLAGQMVE